MGEGQKIGLGLREVMDGEGTGHGTAPTPELHGNSALTPRTSPSPCPRTSPCARTSRCPRPRSGSSWACSMTSAGDLRVGATAGPSLEAAEGRAQAVEGRSQAVEGALEAADFTISLHLATKRRASGPTWGDTWRNSFTVLPMPVTCTHCAHF